MFGTLKNHPFAVEAFFRQSVVLTFALPKTELQLRLPPCLEADTFNGDTAFLAVAMVQTEALRPKGFPAFMGRNFFLIGYRVFVRYKTSAGKNLRGLYILKSETDRRSMEFFGNLFTHYRYTTTDIKHHMQLNGQSINSKRSGFSLDFDDTGDPPLPAGSPFPDWATARRYAGPLPFTFTYEAEKKEVLIIEGVRSNWTPRPIAVQQYHFDFLELNAWNNAVLANAFIIRDIPYYWKKGRTDPWIPTEGPSRAY